MALEQAQRLAILAKGFPKTGGLAFRETDYAHFGQHDRPAKNRTDQQTGENNFSGDRGVPEGKQETASRENLHE